MADNSKIEWTDATWNPITGCKVVSPGCTNCYAMKLAGGRMRNHPSRMGLTNPSKSGPVWNGNVQFNEGWLEQPLRWSKPRMIFVCAHGDLFYEAVPDEWICRVFGVMEGAQRHIFQVLTKRPARAHEWLARNYGHGGELPNVWLGVSAEDQTRADERIPGLLDTPAAVRWVSAEPLIGPIDLLPWLPGLDWIVTGGESGPAARPMHPDWPRQHRDQCAAAGVPFHFKQWGGVNKAAAGRELDGRTHDGYPTQ